MRKRERERESERHTHTHTHTHTHRHTYSKYKTAKSEEVMETEKLQKPASQLTCFASEPVLCCGCVVPHKS